jgi:hypothetical protein
MVHQTTTVPGVRVSCKESCWLEEGTILSCESLSVPGEPAVLNLERPAPMILLEGL